MPRPRPACGTANGYRYHLNHRTRACLPCCDAHAAYNAAQRAARRGCTCGTRPYIGTMCRPCWQSAQGGPRA